MVRYMINVFDTCGGNERETVVGRSSIRHCSHGCGRVLCAKYCAYLGRGNLAALSSCVIICIVGLHVKLRVRKARVLRPCKVPGKYP